ncbi:glutamine synthetase III [Christensenellaceae bacterium OttesenSCG-928-L17]|nr:glutamine synthetase III [Christensenellaceae bacterium OttesenSCG-928-L17]
MCEVTELFGTMVFHRAAMKSRLPREVYRALQDTIRLGKELDDSIAGVVANAMKDWAIEKGVTHFTHWFQPMTGITAEKHDSFLSPSPDGGAIMEFSGKELIKGEPDASSFPSGGLRATFEARGYTAWDPTSPAFIKDETLYIPTIFCSYGGEALDKKTPLLRSMEAVNKQALRVLRLLGDSETKRVNSMVGPEQEYFLVDEALFSKRQDLKFCGRTLFGAMPPKGQEMDDHYFGALKPRVKAFMRDLDSELWKVGVHAKTEHNEVAPGQHELATIYCDANIATDHNQLTMELMQKIARRHGLVCLLQEKPFAGVNGSGKHNNWSLATDAGANLLKPGRTPQENLQFILFLTAIIRAVDTHQDLLRLCAASAGNDHRLGANEAPPAIVSIFLGDELSGVLEAIMSKEIYHSDSLADMCMGVDALPHIHRDSTDRNRTSPFAFTGNKFEFRMLGSSFSIAGPNMVLNTIVADVLQEFADALESVPPQEFELELGRLIRRTLRAHKRILFNGNSYADDWRKEAEKRGLQNLASSVEALPVFITEKNIDLFTRHGVLGETEIHARYEILLENYCKTIHIEAATAQSMVRGQIAPAVTRYLGELAGSMAQQQVFGADIAAEQAILLDASAAKMTLHEHLHALTQATEKAEAVESLHARAQAYRQTVLPIMQSLREAADALELLLPQSVWPLPTYAQLLFDV